MMNYHFTLRQVRTQIPLAQLWCLVAVAQEQNPNPFSKTERSSAGYVAQEVRKLMAAHRLLTPDS
jgi:hypothetical protein